MDKLKKIWEWVKGQNLLVKYLAGVFLLAGLNIFWPVFRWPAVLLILAGMGHYLVKLYLANKNNTAE